MTMTMNYTGTLVVETCCNCGVHFGLPQDMQKRRREDRKTFYCPAGHAQHYTGATEVESLRRQLKYVRESEEFYREQAATERRRASAQKGQVTRIRNMIAKGVCPVAGCRRNFTNVREHMAAEHPEFHKHEED